MTLELDPARAELARSNLSHAGLAREVEVVTGRAVDTLDAMIARNEAPFDLIFIDADKESCPQYLERALAPSRKGTLLLVDNVVRRRRQRRAAGDRCARMATARKLRRPSGVSPELTFASGGSHSLGVPARWLPPGYLLLHALLLCNPESVLRLGRGDIDIGGLK